MKNDAVGGRGNNRIIRKMKSKRAVRWHDLEKGNMVGRKDLRGKTI